MTNERSNGYAAGRKSMQWAVERIKELEAENERLRGALSTARERMEDWAAYADEYWRNKWDLASDLHAIDEALITRKENKE